jgi:hypothetical protein
MRLDNLSSDLLPTCVPPCNANDRHEIRRTTCPPEDQRPPLAAAASPDAQCRLHEVKDVASHRMRQDAPRLDDQSHIWIGRSHGTGTAGESAGAVSWTTASTGRFISYRRATLLCKPLAACPTSAGDVVVPTRVVSRSVVPRRNRRRTCRRLQSVNRPRPVALVRMGLQRLALRLLVNLLGPAHCSLIMISFFPAIWPLHRRPHLLL